MTDKELKSLFRALGRELDARQRAQLERLRKSERELYGHLLLVLADKLSITNGRITSRVSDAGITRAVDQAFRELRLGALKEVHQSVIRDLKAILNGNATYYRNGFEEEGKAGFGKTKQLASDRLFKRMGIDGNTLIKGGYLWRYFNRSTTRDEVIATVSQAIGSRARLNDLFRQLAVTIKGTRQIDGAITRQYSELIVDTYHQEDRAISAQYGQALKFQWASYEGGLIETSRKFCIKRDGQVFNTVEAEKWRNDPDLPKTTKERESGVVVGYTPLGSLPNSAGATSTSMGRWRCRHRTRWISEQMARRIAPNRFN